MASRRVCRYQKGDDGLLCAWDAVSFPPAARSSVASRNVSAIKKGGIAKIMPANLEVKRLDQGMA